MIIKEFKGTGTTQLLILGGVHGNEITPIDTCMLLVDKIKDLSKSYYSRIVILNCINPTGIINNTRDISNQSTNDLNRSLSVIDSEDIASKLASWIREMDVIIDIHSSPNCTEFLLINQDENANSYVEFANNIEVPYLLRYIANNTIKKYGLDLGKISFTLELNAIDKIDLVSSLTGSEIVLDIIKNISLFEVKKEYPKYKPYLEWYYHKDGIFYPDNIIGETTNIIRINC